MSDQPAKCAGTAKQTGEPCKQAPIPGGTVCHYHGGSAPQVRAAAQRRLAEDKARRTLDEVGVEEITDPVAAFKGLVSESYALKDHLANRLASLEDSSDKPSLDRLQAALGAYERAMDRAGKLLATWVSLGLEERYLEQQAKLTRDQLRLLVGLAIAVFDDPELGLDRHKRETATRILQEYAVVAVEDGLTVGIADGSLLVESIRPGWQPGERTFLELTPEQRRNDRHRRISPTGHVAFDASAPVETTSTDTNGSSHG